MVWYRQIWIQTYLGFIVHILVYMVPSKSQNPTFLGQGDLASTQWSHPNRFDHQRPPLGYNDYPLFRGSR